MKESLLGGALLSFFGGAITFMYALFSNGGWSKSKQFGVIGDVLSGAKGEGPRVTMLVGLFLMVGLSLLLVIAAGVVTRRQNRK